MIKTSSKIGNSCGLIFDSALLQLARLKEGDPVNVEGHAGGTITIVPFERDEMGFATRSIWMSINGNRSPSTSPGTDQPRHDHDAAA